MATVTLQPVTRENWEACIRLKPLEAQRGFVAPNVYSLAQSKFQPEMVPMAIYAGETMVGFTMYGLDPDDHNYWIYRLMTDQAHQRKGYARAAMQQLIARLKEQPDCREIVLSYEPANQVAREFYRTLGFVATGEIIWGEEVARLRVK